ncbi:MAG: arsenate reductase ArsC [Acidobacteriota bacterium]
MSERTVLVLCTGNSARSQMAEGFLRNRGIHALSAGTQPNDRVNPYAVRAMTEKGIDITSHYPKHIDTHQDTPIDILLTVCDSAAESCPVGLFGASQRISWSFQDPAAATGTDQEKLEVFRDIRDQIETRINTWLAES